MGRLLDYGCGSGILISDLNAIKPGFALGYEPFMSERANPNAPVFSDFADIEQLAPFSTVTLFETIEHLEIEELDEFLSRVKRVMDHDGSILFSAPVEIGPALFLKEIERFTSKSCFVYSIPELFKAALLGIAAKRADNIKLSHKGFDFRNALKTLSDRGWEIAIIGYGPLPIGTWYGNSQVFFWAKQIKHAAGRKPTT